MNASAPAIAAPSSERSTFVTVLSWILIFLGALNVFSSLTQAAFFDAISGAPLPTVAAGTTDVVIDPAMVDAAATVGSGFSFISLALSLFFTYAAYALLQRHNWARIVYIVIFSIGAAGSVILLALSGLGLGAFTDQLGATFGAFFGVAAFMALALLVLHAWLVKRLVSVRVRAEFEAAGADR